MKTVFCSFLIIIFSTTLLPAQDLSVSTFEFGSGIEDRNIVNADSIFATSMERVYCFTQIDGAKNNTTITHVWYYGDEEKARVELPVNGPNWRTWSSKFILENWSGEWSVDILNADGDVLATKTFRVSGAVADQ